ncbi:molybdenum cofactor guanylyltransferase [Brevibacterium sp. 239c]|uniref:molybdenum cofactor guanylyltransferase n=1 Tax=Brevibacterium sp. 239c TaxID=1965356 RepID=UPI000C75F047|nr:molybdenum cofactor guanylyltransferase [Brevibacterium sp. 239c]
MANTVIVLSGGRSRRFGGVHKPGVLLGERSVISRIIATVRSAVPDAKIWLAGPAEGLSQAEQAEVYTVREEPIFSGPLAGIDAGVRAVRDQHEQRQSGASQRSREASDVTLILAGDMPLVSEDHLQALIASCRETEKPAAGVDDRGKLQFLCAAWPTGLLRSRLADIGDTRDKAVKLLFRGVEVTSVEVDPGTIVDFDTPEEFEQISAEVSAADEGPAGNGSAADRVRPVPAEVLQIRDYAESEIDDGEVAAILEFASRIKHSQSSLSPVLAAFLAGRVHAGGSAGAPTSVEESLRKVEEVLTRRSD